MKIAIDPPSVDAKCPEYLDALREVYGLASDRANISAARLDRGRAMSECLDGVAIGARLTLVTTTETGYIWAGSPGEIRAAMLALPLWVNCYHLSG